MIFRKSKLRSDFASKYTQDVFSCGCGGCSSSTHISDMTLTIFFYSTVICFNYNFQKKQCPCYRRERNFLSKWKAAAKQCHSNLLWQSLSIRKCLHNLLYNFDSTNAITSIHYVVDAHPYLILMVPHSEQNLYYTTYILPSYRESR